MILHSLHDFCDVFLLQPPLADFSPCPHKGPEKPGNKQNLKSGCASSWSRLMQNICWLDPSWHVASLLWTGDLNDVREATNIIKARHYQMKSRGLSSLLHFWVHCKCIQDLFYFKIITFVIQKCLFFISIIFCIYRSVWVRDALCYLQWEMLTSNLMWWMSFWFSVDDDPRLQNLHASFWQGHSGVQHFCGARATGHTWRGTAATLVPLKPLCPEQNWSKTGAKWSVLTCDSQRMT